VGVIHLASVRVVIDSVIGLDHAALDAPHAAMTEGVGTARLIGDPRPVRTLWFDGVTFGHLDVAPIKALTRPAGKTEIMRVRQG
jgi:hypothetical protein